MVVYVDSKEDCWEREKPSTGGKLHLSFSLSVKLSLSLFHDVPKKTSHCQIVCVCGFNTGAFCSIFSILQKESVWESETEKEKKKEGRRRRRRREKSETFFGYQMSFHNGNGALSSIHQGISIRRMTSMHWILLCVYEHYTMFHYVWHDIDITRL